MNCWELLGIPPTGDARSIKKAYTRQLRKFSPESDPEGFKNLRAAYEEALFLVQCGLIAAEASEPPDIATEILPAGVSGAAKDSPGSVGNRAPSPSGPPDIPAIRIPEAPQPSEGVETALARIRQDFPDHALRESESYWKELADSDLLWDLSAKAELGAGLFRFLGETYLERGSRYTSIHVPGESWKVLDDAFGWLENEGEWYARFSEDLANAVLDRIRAARGLAQSTDLQGTYQPARDLLIEGSDPLDRYRWAWPLIVIVGILALNGVFFRCS